MIERLWGVGGTGRRDERQASSVGNVSGGKRPDQGVRRGRGRPPHTFWRVPMRHARVRTPRRFAAATIWREVPGECRRGTQECVRHVASPQNQRFGERFLESADSQSSIKPWVEPSIQIPSMVAGRSARAARRIPCRIAGLERVVFAASYRSDQFSISGERCRQRGSPPARR